IPIEVSPERYHSERLAHPGSDELLGVRVQDDLIKRVGVAIEDRRYDAVGRGGDAVTEDRIDLLAGKSQQASQRSISDLFPPLSEQMEDEKERGRFHPLRWFQGQMVFDLLEEHGHHLAALSGGGFQRFPRKTLDLREFSDNRRLV